MFRFLFPSFEKPVDRPRYINIEQDSRDFRGIGAVLALAAVCGLGFVLWEPSHQVTTPFVTATPARPTPATASAKAPETTAVAAEAEEDQVVAPTVKLSAQCAQRATARRDCASVRAFKDARLNAPEPAAPEPDAVPSKPEAVATKVSASAEPAVVPQASAMIAETPAVAPSDTPVVQTQKTAAAPKAKRPRPAEEAPVERLVRVYDQVLPDGRRVPVYRRVGTGALETGSIVDGEYRPGRRAANLDSPSSRYFGLQ